MSDGQWGAKTKDRLGVKLKNLVCKGEVSLRVAREEVRRNWVAAFKKYVDLSGREAWVGEAGE